MQIFTCNNRNELRTCLFCYTVNSHKISAKKISACALPKAFLCLSTNSEYAFSSHWENKHLIFQHFLLNTLSPYFNNTFKPDQHLNNIFQCEKYKIYNMLKLYYNQLMYFFHILKI